MTDDPWKAHISYLEEEVRKLSERADKLEAMEQGVESAQKKLAIREMINRLRSEATEHRKFLLLISPK